MQKVLTAEEMREVDRLTIEKYRIPSIILMENAAHATARIITEKLGGSVKGRSILILCGKGNNGGDGAALGRILAGQGALVSANLFGKRSQTTGDARINFEILNRTSVQVGASRPLGYEPREIFLEHDLRSLREGRDSINFDSFDVIVDGLLGTGLNRKLDGDLAWLVDDLYRFNRFEIESLENLGRSKEHLFVSLDLPSGLMADLPEQIGDTFQADVTVTFTAPKFANVLSVASNFNGELYIADIGSPRMLIYDSPSQTYLVEKEDARIWAVQTKFSSDSYKNKRGNALLIVGSKRYSGAAVLAGNGAMQSGVGLTTVVTSESACNSVSERILPEVMVRGVAETEGGAVSEEAFDEIFELSKKADVLAIGSGLDSSEKTTKKLVLKVVRSRKTPIVIDADGLNALSPFEINGSDEYPLVLTPHEGEFLRLLGTEDKGKLKDRVGAVREFAQKHNVILVLKGERNLIAEPGGKVVINPTGNAGLGKAGNGDNLTGIITGFMAQAVQAKVDIFETVVAAVYIAGYAADIAEKKFGKRAMSASDVKDSLVEAFREVERIDE